MPLEVRELNIKVTVSDSQSGADNGDSDGGGSQSDDLIKLIVEKVLEVLDKRRER